MPPKGANRGATNQKPKEEQREETLQAVVLADSYERRFAPFTLNKPRCLLPLANTPLIEYTLEFLANAGVEDVFICCGAHTQQVEDYIQVSKWKSSSSPFSSVNLIRSTATSVGDAMRDLDKRDLITGDFLLVSGDVVANVSLQPALARHRARREKDKNAIMTMVLREAGVEHRTKSRGRRPVFVIESQAGRCLHYEEVIQGKRGDGRIHIDPELLTSHQEIEVRQDLIDCYIDICAPDVLSLWSDNFDYQSVRKSFLFGVLKDYELNGKTIHTYIMREGYAARVRSLRAYDAVSKDIISRWTYPLCPDSNIVAGQRYRLDKCKVYTEEGVVLARGSEIRHRSVLGGKTSVGDGSIVSDSVIGRRCHIGRNVRIEGSYIWDDVVIADGTVIKQAVIANEAVIKQNCIIKPGALISFAAQVAENTVVPSNARLTSRGQQSTANGTSDATSDSILDYASDSSASSTGSVYSSRLYLSPSASSSASSISTLNSETTFLPSRRESFISNSDEPAKSRTDFVDDAKVSVLESLTNSVSPDVIHLELISLRMTTNASDAELREALVGAYMNRIFNLMKSGTGARDAAGAVFRTYGKMMSQLGIFDTDRDDKTDQVDILKRIEGACRGRERGDAVLLFATKEAYERDVVQEEGVLQWWEDGGEGVEGRNLVKDFVVWLQEAESESSSDED